MTWLGLALDPSRRFPEGSQQRDLALLLARDARILIPRRLGARWCPGPHAHDLKMACRVGGRRFRLAQAGSGSDGEHQALIGHLQQIRAQACVMEEALLELEKDEIERGEQLGVVEAAQELT